MLPLVQLLVRAGANFNFTTRTTRHYDIVKFLAGMAKVRISSSFSARYRNKEHIFSTYSVSTRAENC